MLILHIILFSLFVLGALMLFKFEQVIYAQKDNKQGYDNIETSRKRLRNVLFALYFTIGMGADLIGFRSIPTLFAGMVAYWILFDGLYATKVIGQGWWGLGKTFTKRQISSTKKMKLYKMIALAVAIIGVILNCIL